MSSGGGGGQSFPQPPSAQEMVGAWVGAMPQVYDTQLEYQPKMANMEIDNARKTALPLALAYKQAQEALYPGTSALQEDMVSKANLGMEQGLPGYALDQYRSDLMGSTAAGSPIAGDYMSRQLLMANQGEKQRNEGLALSLLGRQPMVQPQAAQQLQWAQGFDPATSSATQMQGYGSYSSGLSNVMSANIRASAAKYGANMGLLGSAFGMFGNMAKAASGQGGSSGGPY